MSVDPKKTAKILNHLGEIEVTNTLLKTSARSLDPEVFSGQGFKQFIDGLKDYLDHLKDLADVVKDLLDDLKDQE